MDKFDWQASESGPKGYPMQIVSGRLYFQDGSGSLNVPEGATLYNGWGDENSSNAVGDDLKPLPNRLSITFFSYTENQFYSGKFDLPYEKILKLFQEGYVNPNPNIAKIYKTYSDIVVGVAPGGAVSVWLLGINRTTEVFFGHADKIDGDWGWINNNPKYPRPEYVRLELEDSLTKEEQESLSKDGVPVGRWNHYHNARYHWQPLFTDLPLYEGRINQIRYYNGEFDFIPYPLKNEAATFTRAVPSELVFVWDRPHQKPLMIELYFNETEIFDTFAKVAKAGLPIQLEMRMAVKENGKHDFTVWVRNEKDSIELKQFNVKTYGIPERMLKENRNK